MLYSIAFIEILYTYVYNLLPLMPISALQPYLSVSGGVSSQPVSLTHCDKYNCLCLLVFLYRVSIHGIL